ncbi:hypothetical protein QTG54_008491 [Skeletonema marinoi]|uniref:Uncharacterized protein n=1 Tax=Skeletonema marinoi TaxID=267567 RepID=A0AAD9DAK4_9STRA|nr:hypothetical protein QTG54_008491 [Skeletonema marinoi]
MSDGTYRDQSVDDDSRAEKMPVTPSPQRRSRVCYAETIEKTNQEPSSDDGVGNDHVVAKKKGARRKIIYEESDDNDTATTIITKPSYFLYLYPRLNQTCLSVLRN